MKDLKMRSAGYACVVAFDQQRCFGRKLEKSTVFGAFFVFNGRILPSEIQMFKLFWALEGFICAMEKLSGAMESLISAMKSFIRTLGKLYRAMESFITPGQ